MNQADRQQAVAGYLAAVGVCSYQELARRFDVSEMTVRRDIDCLAKRGVVIKMLGGAQTAHAAKNLYESAFEQRLSSNLAEKQQIAEVALGRLEPGRTVFLDGSTTCLVLAGAIARSARRLTLVTNSAAVCMELARSTENTIVGFGGQFDPLSACFVGPRAEEESRQMYFDTFFLSTKGFLAGEGTFESSPATLRLKQIVAERSARVVLLVDHTKFGARALCKVLDISQIDEVITDSGVSDADLRLLERASPVVTVAGRSVPEEETAVHVP